MKKPIPMELDDNALNDELIAMNGRFPGRWNGKGWMRNGL